MISKLTILTFPLQTSLYDLFTGTRERQIVTHMITATPNQLPMDNIESPNIFFFLPRK